MLTAVIAAAAESGGATGYILHHETNLANKAAHGIVDFSVINYDTFFISLFLGLLTVFLLWLAARKATSGERKTRTGFPACGKALRRARPGSDHRPP